MQLDPLDLVEGLSSQVPFPTVGATDDWDVLDDEQVCAPAVAARNVAQSSTSLPANITDDRGCLGHAYARYVVMITNRPDGLNFATTSTDAPSGAVPLTTYFDARVCRSRCRSTIVPVRTALSTSKMVNPSSSISSSAWTLTGQPLARQACFRLRVCVSPRLVVSPVSTSANAGGEGGRRLWAD